MWSLSLGGEAHPSRQFCQPKSEVLMWEPHPHYSRPVMPCDEQRPQTCPCTEGKEHNQASTCSVAWCGIQQRWASLASHPVWISHSQISSGLNTTQCSRHKTTAYCIPLNRPVHHKILNYTAIRVLHLGNFIPS